MRALIPVLMIVALGSVSTSRAQAQVRVSIGAGIGHRWGYGRGYGLHAQGWHPARGCYASRSGCYRSEVVIIRRPVYRAPVVVVRPGYGYAHRYPYRRHRW